MPGNTDIEQENGDTFVGWSDERDTYENDGESDQLFSNGHRSDDDPPQNETMLNKLLWYFLPSERLPICFIIFLTVLAGIPGAAYVVVFTKMCFGIKYFYYLADRFEYLTVPISTGLSGLFVILYLLDFSYWYKLGPAGVTAQGIVYTVFIVGVTVCILVNSHEFAYGPVCLVGILTPVWLCIIKGILFPRYEFRQYVTYLSMPLFNVSVIISISWLIWLGLDWENNQWSGEMQFADAAAVGCEPDLISYPKCSDNTNPEKPCVVFHHETNSIQFPDQCAANCLDVYDNCLNTFIVWIGPALVSCVYFFMSFTVTFLKPGSDIQTQMSVFVSFWLFLLFILWCAAGLVGAGDGISNAIGAFVATAFVGSLGFAAACFDREERTDSVKNAVDIALEKAGSVVDWVKGLFVLFCGPAVVIYVWLSFMNQMIRKCNCPVSKKIKTEEDRRGWLTKRCRKQIAAFMEWDHTKVFTYAIYIGILMLIFQVICAKFTTLFLAWLIEYTSSMNLFAITGIMFGVGLVMFLLPPVPGAPIYITFGVVVIKPGSQLFGVVGAIFYCIAVSTLLKLAATFLQQVAIGQSFSNFVSIRKMCQVNSPVIRATRLLLSEPGLKGPKISILVGGPDWPTSVLCGIMRLSVVQVLIGTLPVVVVVVPFVLAGSFTYMGGMTSATGDVSDQGNQEVTLLYPWANTCAKIMMALSAMVLFSFTILFMKSIEGASRDRADEIAALPYDDEVMEQEKIDERKQAAHDSVTKWDKLPCWVKAVLLLSLILMSITCFIFNLMGKKCFRPFTLTSTIDKDLDGKWYNLVMPLGAAGLALFAASWALLTVFTSWAGMMVDRLDIDSFVPEKKPFDTERSAGEVTTLIENEHYPDDAVVDVKAAPHDQITREVINRTYNVPSVSVPDIEDEPKEQPTREEITKKYNIHKLLIPKNGVPA